jgi:hypothetical protein
MSTLCDVTNHARCAILATSAGECKPARLAKGSNQVFQVQIKTAPNAAWKLPRVGQFTFNSLPDSISAAQSLDQDGYFSFKARDVRIFNTVTNERVTTEDVK